MNEEEAVDPHFLALYASVTALYELVDMLPECDLVIQISDLIGTQLELLDHIFQDKHFGTDRLKSFIEYTNYLKYEMGKLRDAVEER